MVLLCEAYCIFPPRMKAVSYDNDSMHRCHDRQPFTNFEHYDGNGYYDNTFCELRDFTGLTSINDYEFAGSSIWEVVIPENVTRIGDYAFQNLIDIYIPKNVNSIGYNAFMSAENYIRGLCEIAI